MSRPQGLTPPPPPPDPLFIFLGPAEALYDRQIIRFGLVVFSLLPHWSLSHRFASIVGWNFERVKIQGLAEGWG